MDWLYIYSDENIKTWENRLAHARFTLNLNHDERKKFLTKKDF